MESIRRDSIGDKAPAQLIEVKRGEGAAIELGGGQVPDVQFVGNNEQLPDATVAGCRGRGGGTSWTTVFGPAFVGG